MGAFSRKIGHTKAAQPWRVSVKKRKLDRAVGPFLVLLHSKSAGGIAKKEERETVT